MSSENSSDTAKKESNKKEEQESSNNNPKETELNNNNNKEDKKQTSEIIDTKQYPEKDSKINDIMDKLIDNEKDWEMHPIEGPIGMSSAEKDPDEYRHLRNVVSAFFNYQIDSLRDVSRMERDFKLIGEKYSKLMSFDYKERLDKLKIAIWKNYSFLLKVADPYKNMFKLYKGKSGEILMEPLIVEIKDIVKMRSTLRLFIRDWAKEGIEERNSTYKPILEELKRFFEKRPKKDFEEGINVLVPGAGLGRLMYEIAKLGFKSQGNEFSYYMLLCSNYMFNNTTKKDEFILQPLIHSFSNIDSIVTCYFIDTANNVIEYIETIHNILKEGGLWINFGPLLYHYTENENEISIELSWEEVKHIIIGYGFEFKKIEIVKATYSSNINSMTQRIYSCVFFSAVKIK